MKLDRVIRIGRRSAIRIFRIAKVFGPDPRHPANLDSLAVDRLGEGHPIVLDELLFTGKWRLTSIHRLQHQPRGPAVEVWRPRSKMDLAIRRYSVHLRVTSNLDFIQFHRHAIGPLFKRGLRNEKLPAFGETTRG